MDKRDAQGRFVAGYAGGPGRPKRATEAAYLETLRRECPPARWREIVRRAVADAEAGDDRARAWLGAYLLGKPAPLAPVATATAIVNLPAPDWRALIGQQPLADGAPTETASA